MTAGAYSSTSRWLEVVSHLDPKYGGLSTAVPALSAAIAQATGDAVSVAAFCASNENFVPEEARTITVRHFPLRRTEWAREHEMKERFHSMVREAAGVHIHGLWQHSTAQAARSAQQMGHPYMVSAHGMLERWALRQKRWKKAIYAVLVERRLLRRAACLHALTHAEAEDYRRFGLSNPIAVIPNGVTVRPEITPEPFFEHFPALRGRRLLLFLGRLHPKKGLSVLCDAWSAVERRWPDAHLVIAGPDDQNTRAALEQRCAAAGSRRMTFTGLLQGDLKWSALRAAEAFLLPSYSEGLSVSVLEAMGMGLPVIVSKQCNLPEVFERQCGWVIAPEREALSLVMEECLRLPRAARIALGANGQRLVESRYSWQRVGREMAAVYEWMAGGPKPVGLFAEEGEAPRAAQVRASA